MKEEQHHPVAPNSVYEVRLTPLGRSLRAGCVAVIVTSFAGATTGVGTVKVLNALGVHMERGFAPLSLTVNVTTPCAAFLNGNPTSARWENVLFEKTYGFNAQTLETWSAEGEVGHKICK